MHIEVGQSMMLLTYSIVVLPLLIHYDAIVVIKQLIYKIVQWFIMI